MFEIQREGIDEEGDAQCSWLLTCPSAVQMDEGF